MRPARRTLMVVACAAAFPALAQNTTDAQCGSTNYDRARGVYTIVNPASDATNEQCFITVVPKASWPGGAPDLASSQLVEGNYNVVLSGGGAGGSAPRTGAGFDGADAVPFKGTRYLAPGVYRVTLGSGGKGGQPCLNEELGGRGNDGAPTGLSEAYTGQTVAGFPRAESWDARYAQSYPVASAGRTPGSPDIGNMTPAARVGDLGGGGHSVAAASGGCQVGAKGGSGFLQLALADTPPRLAPAQPAQPAPAMSSGAATPPPAESIRPARRDRN